MNYIALLRGINVSGKNLIKMNELVAIIQSIEYQNVRTYIQSGNILFETNERNLRKIESEIHDKILEEFGFDVPVLVISREMLNTVFENNPFINKNNSAIEKLYVTFLSDTPEQENIQKLNEIKNIEFKFSIENNVVYISCEKGYGNSKLNNNLFENKLKVSATTRNWKTVKKLLEMVEEQ